MANATLLSTAPPVLYRLADVRRALNLGRTAIYGLLATDPTFPQPVRLTKRAVAWHRDEIEAWARARPRVERPAQTAEGVAIGMRGIERRNGRGGDRAARP